LDKKRHREKSVSNETKDHEITWNSGASGLALVLVHFCGVGLGVTSALVVGLSRLPFHRLGHLLAELGLGRRARA
jgi:hypothetical protein